jgi:hypothetical protein
MSFERRVWQEMSRLNVNDKTSKKMNLTYLSWSDCWATLADYYPESNYEFGDPKYYPDDTVEVSCTVIIKEGEHAFSRIMYLPVMDHRNNSVPNPTSRQISDARQRCLVKAVAVATGLGLYIYRGEDIPAQGKPPITAALRNRFIKTINLHLENNDGAGAKEVYEELCEDPQVKDYVKSEYINSEHDGANKLKQFTLLVNGESNA